jgi:ABC-type amino acid transport system permease subunit
MKKFIITVILLNSFIWFALSNFMANADDKTTATVGHIISETIKGTDIDTTAILEKELQTLAHNYAIDMINIMQVYLPAILDGIAADLRMKADEKYKCKLLENGGMNDGCNN